jgi:hypothetical protein
VKTAFAYLFRRVRRLVEIPPEFIGGDPRCTITVNLRPFSP